MAVHGELGGGRLLRQHGRRGDGPHGAGQRLGHRELGHGGGHLGAPGLVPLVLGAGILPGRGGGLGGGLSGGVILAGAAHVAVERRGQLLVGGEVPGGVLPLLEVDEAGAPVPALPPVLVEGAVAQGVGLVPAGAAEGADVLPQHGTAHGPRDGLEGVAAVLQLGLAIREAEGAVVTWLGGEIHLGFKFSEAEEDLGSLKKDRMT